MVSDWELLLGGDNTTHDLLLRVTDNLTQRRREQLQRGRRSNPQPPQRSQSPSSDGAQRPTVQPQRVPQLAPSPTLPRGAPSWPFDNRQPSVTNSDPFYATQMPSYVAQQQTEMFALQQQGYPLPDPHAHPPPMPMCQTALPPDQVGRVTLPFIINGIVKHHRGTYTLSQKHSTISRRLADEEPGNIRPNIPPVRLGFHTMMSLYIPVDNEGRHEHIPFQAEIDGYSDTPDFCIGEDVWLKIIKVRPDLGKGPPGGEPEGPSSFDGVGTSGAAAPMISDITPAPSMYSASHNFAHAHVGMGDNTLQLSDYSDYASFPFPASSNAAVEGFSQQSNHPFMSTAPAETGDVSFIHQMGDPSMATPDPMSNGLGEYSYDNGQGYGSGVVSPEEEDDPNLYVREFP